MSDPFHQLAEPVRPVRPRAEFVSELRALIEAELGLTGPDPAASELTVAADPAAVGADVPEVPLPARAPVDPTHRTNRPSSRRSTVPSTAPPSTSASSAGDRLMPAVIATSVVPYLAVTGAMAAIEFYQRAFGAEEHHRVLGPDGTVGHAEIHIGDAVVYLSDPFPGHGVRSPADLGGTPVTLHLTVADADAVFQRAVEAGADPLSEPADQPHGARHGTVLDPFGHRWMLSQPVRDLDIDTYRSEMSGDGWSVETGPVAARAASPAAGDNGRIWAAVNAADAPAMIRFLVDVLGFSEQLVVPGDQPDVIVHSQMRWPEGGVVQVSSAGRGHSPFTDRPIGAESLYVITDDPMAVYRRCVEAGVEVVSEPEVQDYDDTGKPTFSLRDPEGNLWSFGAYAGEA